MFTLIADVIANNILLFRILGSILIFILFWTLKSPVTKQLIKLLDKLLNRKRQIADHSTLTFVLTPLKSFFAASGIYLALVNLNPSAGMEHFLLKVYRISVIIIVTWILLRLCDCASDSFFRFGNKLDEQLDVNLNKTLMTFLKKALKVLLIVLAAIAILSETGTNVTTIITGLGLGGLTFALAAQDTAQNLFGGLVILLDKPFAVDDWISTPNIEGVVEDITFRSTRIRTFPNALVVVPNSSLVSSPITNWSRMNKRRATFSIGLTYDTPKEKMEECVARITEMVNSNEEILANDTVIRFNSFQDSSLEISLMYFTKPTSFSDFQRIKEQVNYGIMQIVEDLGLSFAFPTQTLYVHPEVNICFSSKAAVKKPLSIKQTDGQRLFLFAGFFMVYKPSAFFTNNCASAIVCQ